MGNECQIQSSPRSSSYNELDKEFKAATCLPRMHSSTNSSGKWVRHIDQGSRPDTSKHSEFLNRIQTNQCDH
ncbi:hypothetical protein TNCV_1628051 [Trichonephila clavipes]|nr:hypothetical protein TNCV_1628051 [Trichonephila clavipes]